MKTCLLLLLTSLSSNLAGVIVSTTAQVDDPPYLRGVPIELREKILAFHRVLSTPDNFTQPPPPTTPETESKSPMGGFGLAEATTDDMMKKKEVDKDAGELQNDLFRFSNKVTVPHSGHSNITPNLSNRQNFVNFIQRKEKLRQRIQQEWRRFIKWRTQKRKKKRLKRRIMRTLNKRLKNQFGRIGLSGKRTKEEVKAFNRRKKLLKRKIKRRLKQKQRMKHVRRIPGRASLPEQRLKTRNLRSGKKLGKKNKKSIKKKKKKEEKS